jgi:hypothetical protein
MEEIMKPYKEMSKEELLEELQNLNEEYRKYQEITLSPVEEEYLKSIKGVEKEVKKRSRTKK